MDFKFSIHYSFHFIFPLLIAFFFFRKNWKKVYLIFIATMAIDLDHLLATPIFDPNRCSINFHPLHTYYAFVVYILLAIYKRTRILGLGLLMHLLADAIDCFL